VDLSAPLGTASPTIEACGGGAASCATVSDDTVLAEEGYFAVERFDGRFLDELGDPQSQAGSNPYIVTNEVFAASLLNSQGFESPTQAIRDISVELPPGLVGNPLAVPTCTQAQIQGLENKVQCPAESQVGLVEVCFGGFFTLFVGPGGCVTGPV